jgi:hypothetical protein
MPLWNVTLEFRFLSFLLARECVFHRNSSDEDSACSISRVARVSSILRLKICYLQEKMGNVLKRAGDFVHVLVC